MGRDKRKIIVQLPTNKPYYRIWWKTNKSDFRNHLHLKIKVEASIDDRPELFFPKLKEETDKHFKNRTYSIAPVGGEGPADMWDAIYHAVYFYDLLAGKKFRDLKVVEVQAHNEDGVFLTLTQDSLVDLPGIETHLVNTTNE